MSDAFWAAAFSALVPTLTVIAQWKGQNNRLKKTDAKVEKVAVLVNGKATEMQRKIDALKQEVTRLKRLDDR